MRKAYYSPTQSMTSCAVLGKSLRPLGDPVYGTPDGLHAISVTQVSHRPPDEVQGPPDTRFLCDVDDPCLGVILDGHYKGMPVAVPVDRVGALLRGELSSEEYATGLRLASEIADRAGPASEAYAAAILHRPDPMILYEMQDCSASREGFGSFGTRNA